MQADREVVLTAVSNDGRALRYASPELQSDVLLAAYAGRGLAQLHRDLESGNHTFDADMLEQLSTAAVCASKQKLCSHSLAQRVAMAVFEPNGAVHARERAGWEWGHLTAAAE